MGQLVDAISLSVGKCVRCDLLPPPPPYSRRSERFADSRNWRGAVSDNLLSSPDLLFSLCVGPWTERRRQVRPNGGHLISQAQAHGRRAMELNLYGLSARPEPGRSRRRPSTRLSLPGVNSDLLRSVHPSPLLSLERSFCPVQLWIGYPLCNLPLFSFLSHTCSFFRKPRKPSLSDRSQMKPFFELPSCTLGHSLRAHSGSNNMQERGHGEGTI